MNAAAQARDWLARIAAIAPARPIRVMNVCGGHERSISMAGLRGVLPDWITLIPGPGCPVCVCPEEDVHAAIGLARRPGTILVAFGDMLRVPTNGPRAQPRSLQEARAAGADVRPVASPAEAVRIAHENPGQELVFFAAGFETTSAPVAAMIAQGLPANMSVLLSARRTWPAVAMLLGSDTPGFDALVAPGHVAAVMGSEEWRFVAERHGLPCAVAGFEPASLLAALHAVISQHISGRPALENCYEGVVTRGGNPTARALLDGVFETVDAPWRGIGTIPASGFAIRRELARLDARARFDMPADPARTRAGQMPPGCDCARVVLGRIAPDQCSLFGRACTPRTPVGPCMVSDEGACRIWWSAGTRRRRADAAD